MPAEKSLITGKGLFTCNGVLASLEIDQWKREGRNRREQSKFRNQTIRQTLRVFVSSLWCASPSGAQAEK